MSGNEPDAGRVTLRRARAGEAAAISALALRSKAMWGYSQAFMDACREELTYTEADIIDPQRTIFVGVEEQTLAGFYALSAQRGGLIELDGLFVEPALTGHGVGARLMRDALRRAARQGAHTLVIQSDPYAEDFYRAMGAAKVGERPSHSIPGRTLPLMTFALV